MSSEPSSRCESVCEGWRKGHSSRARALGKTVKAEQTENGSWSTWPGTRAPIFGSSDESLTVLATLAVLPAAAAGDDSAKAVRDKAVRWLADRLPSLRRRDAVDLVVVNAENAAVTGPCPTDGFGMTEVLVRALVDGGVDVVTSGNHAWEGPDADRVLGMPHVLRPLYWAARQIPYLFRRQLLPSPRVCGYQRRRACRSRPAAADRLAQNSAPMPALRATTGE